jgi:peptidoglycan-associated lipoprotein
MKASYLAIAVVLGLTGCAGAEAPPPRTPAAPPEAPAASSEKSPSRSLVNVAEEIRAACGIPESDAHFAFDSAHVEQTDYPTLDKLVTCFSTGPLAHRHMHLVGHTDPRGAEEYNLALGGSRADEVRGFLLHHGLATAQVASTSRGERDAQGTDEPSWASDRRVDVQLAN